MTEPTTDLADAELQAKISYVFNCVFRVKWEKQARYLEEERRKGLLHYHEVAHWIDRIKEILSCKHVWESTLPYRWRCSVCEARQILRDHEL